MEMQKNENRLGYKKTKVGWIPEDWESVQLGECLPRKPEYGINAPAVEFSEELPTYLRITNISDDGTFISQSKVSVKARNSLDYRMQEGDLVFARTSAKSNKIILNQELIKASKRHIDYVIIHELCHLTYKQHSRAFYVLLELELSLLG